MLIGSGGRFFSHARGKQVGATTWGAQMLGWDQAGRRTNRLLAWGGLWADGKSSVPHGRSHPSAWLLPLKTGGLASHNELHGVGEVSATGVRGLPGTVAITASAAISASMGLIVAGSASISAGATVAANAIAVLQGAAAISGTSSVASSIGALAGLSASLTGSATVSAPAYALGHMASDITPFTELSPQSLATAVWAAVAVDNDDAGSMGEKLNDAGAAANPWTEEVEAGLDAKEAMRLIVAAVAGKLSGAESTTITIRNAVADDKNRIVATVDENGNRSSITYDLAD